MSKRKRDDCGGDTPLQRVLAWIDEARPLPTEALAVLLATCDLDTLASSLPSLEAVRNLPTPPKKKKKKVAKAVSVPKTLDIPSYLHSKVPLLAQPLRLTAFAPLPILEDLAVLETWDTPQFIDMKQHCVGMAIGGRGLSILGNFFLGKLIVGMRVHHPWAVVLRQLAISESAAHRYQQLYVLCSDYPGLLCVGANMLFLLKHAKTIRKAFVGDEGLRNAYASASKGMEIVCPDGEVRTLLGQASVKDVGGLLPERRKHLLEGATPVSMEEEELFAAGPTAYNDPEKWEEFAAMASIKEAAANMPTDEDERLAFMEENIAASVPLYLDDFPEADEKGAKEVLSLAFVYYLATLRAEEGRDPASDVASLFGDILDIEE